MSLLSSVTDIAKQTGRQAGESAYSQASAKVLSAAGVSRVPGEDATSAGAARNGATSGVGPSPLSEASVVGGRSAFSVSGAMAYAKANPIKAIGAVLLLAGGLWYAFKKKK